MEERFGRFLKEALYEIAALDSEIIYLAMLVVITVIVIDALSLIAGHKRRQTGMTKSSVAVSVDGSRTLPHRNYVSDVQGLAGRPDAVIIEQGFPVPVERKPLAKKLRDRYVAQLLVYMRLVEEFEGKKPPYGYLILGPSARRIKIHNTDERQAWVQKYIDQMRAILTERAKAVPSPDPRKCKRCPVNKHCSYRADVGRTTSV